MRDYVITVNSTVDLPKEWLEERHVPVVPLKYTIDGETYTDMEGLSAKEFFAKPSPKCRIVEGSSFLLKRYSSPGFPSGEIKLS